MAESSNPPTMATLDQRQKRSQAKAVLRSRYRGYCYSWRLANNAERRSAAADRNKLVDEKVQEKENLPCPSAQLMLNPLPQNVDETTRSALRYCQ